MDLFKREYYMQAVRELTVNLASLWHRFNQLQGGGGDYPLPDGWEFGGSIASNGSAELITDITLTQADTLEIRYKRSAQSRAFNLLGAYTGTAALNNFSLYLGSTAPLAYYRYNGQVQRGDVPNDDQEHTTAWGTSGAYFDGAKVLDAFEPSQPFESDVLYICSLANSTQNKFMGDIYEIKIMRNGKVIHHLRPCGQWQYSGGGIYQESNPAFFDTKTGIKYDCGAGFTVKNLENYPED